MTQVTLTNLVAAASMEGTGWSGGSYSTSHALFGTRSLLLTGTTATPEAVAPTTASMALTPSHLYYSRVYGYQETRTNASVGFYWPIAEPSFQEGIPIGPAGRWNLYSGRTNRTAFAAGSYQLRLDYNNSYIAGSMWFDGCILLDLTAAFGAGNEPEKDWCDECIPFFEGSLVLETYPFSGVTVTGMSLAPNPAKTKQAVAVSAQVQEVNALLRPAKRYCGGFYAGEE